MKKITVFSDRGGRASAPYDRDPFMRIPAIRGFFAEALYFRKTSIPIIGQMTATAR